jgi:O-antigen/teichoic acid export membrane protein
VSTKPLINRVFSSTIANAITFITLIFQNIVLVPILLENWGKEKYGIWIIIFNFFSLLHIFDTGHHNYVGNEFNKYYYSDKIMGELVLGSGIVISLGIGLVEFLVTIGLVSLGTFAETVVGIPATFGEQEAKWGLVVLVGMWFLMGGVGGLLVRIILPLGLMTEMLYISLIIKVAQALVLLAGASLQWTILHTCLAFSLAQIIYTLGVSIFIYKKMPEFFPWWKRVSWKVGLRNLSRSFVLTANGMLEQLSTNGLILLISNFRGPAAVPLFSTMRTVANTALQGTNMVIQSLHPDLIRFHSSGQPEKVEQVLIFNWLFTGSLVNLGLLALQLVAQPLYIWWTKGALEFDLSLLNWLILGVAIANFNRGPLMYLQGMNHLRSMSLVSTSRFLLVASISLFFVKMWGLSALGASLVVAELACTYWIIHFSRHLLKEIGGHLPKNVLFLAFFPVVILAGCFIVIEFQVLPLPYLLLIGAGAMLYFYTQLFGLASPDLKSQIANFAKRTLHLKP